MTELSKAYGGALFALAVDENCEETYLNQLEEICSVLRDQPDYTRLIESRAISRTERLALLDEAFSGRVDAYVLNFMKILCERGAFARLDECREAYVHAYNERHNIAAATVVSAAPLSDDQVARLKSALEAKTGKTIQLNEKIDAQVRGGLRVEMEGRRYDNTVATKMDRLRKALLTQS